MDLEWNGTRPIDTPYLDLCLCYNSTVDVHAGKIFEFSILQAGPGSIRPCVKWMYGHFGFGYESVYWLVAPRILGNDATMLLMTGSTGFIGRALLKQLVDMGVEVRSLIRPSPKSPNLPRGVLLNATLSSLADLRGIRAALIGVNTVIHLASSERLGLRGYRSEREVEGTRNLAQASVDAGVQRFIFVSHLGANLTSAYTVLRTKAMEEEQIRKSGVPHTIIRPSLIYGSEDHFTTSVAKMLSLLPLIFPLPGTGDTLIQPLWVKDFVTAISWTIDEPGTLGQTYEVGGPEFLSFKQVVQLVMAATKRPRLIVNFRPPYLRAGAWVIERILKKPPITTFWLDYLAVNRTTDLGSMSRAFGLQPARMESNLDYLRNRPWVREFFSEQLKSERSIG